jgi:hypothetical protein
MYCLRLSKCGTFIPLSRVRGEFRITVVWTWFVARGLYKLIGSLQDSVRACGFSFGGGLRLVQQDSCGRARIGGRL